MIIYFRQDTPFSMQSELLHHIKRKGFKAIIDHNKLFTDANKNDIAPDIELFKQWISKTKEAI